LLKNPARNAEFTDLGGSIVGSAISEGKGYFKEVSSFEKFVEDQA
jgi:hypothetical protein